MADGAVDQPPTHNFRLLVVLEHSESDGVHIVKDRRGSVCVGLLLCLGRRVRGC